MNTSKTTLAKTTLLALATSALLTVGATAASAQEFTIPNGAFDHNAAAPASTGAAEFTAIFQGRSAAAHVAGNGYSEREWRENGGVAVQTR
jgi:hypothetical protein